MARVRCRYNRSKEEPDCRIQQESDRGRLHSRSDNKQRGLDPFAGSKREQTKKNSRRRAAARACNAQRNAQ